MCACVQVCALQWNPHEREILSSHGFSQNQLCLWKYPSMAKVGEFTGHSARVLHMARVRCQPDRRAGIWGRLRSFTCREQVLQHSAASWQLVDPLQILLKSYAMLAACRAQTEPLCARQLLTKHCASGAASASLHLQARPSQQLLPTVLCPPLPFGK